PPRQDDRPPEYTRGDVAAALEKEPDFQGLCRELEGMLGRVFTDSDLRCAYTIYDHLGLPPEVILLLAGWAVRRERRAKNSPAACPRMPQIQRMAFQWKRLGLDTLERAEDYLRRQEAVDGREWAVLQAVGVAERRPAVEREREYIAAWVGMGLSDELIHMAYERTVYQKKAMNWPYMNKILLSWHQAGYKTPQQVEAGDKPPRRSAAGVKAPPRDFQPSQERIQKNNDWLDQFLGEQQRGGGEGVL
ncbi:MAG: DnaD domain protein, partial [Oscillospiraceae bacterium]|nr:DnaD domain protein [Oscillospiraceae bacterium]